MPRDVNGVYTLPLIYKATTGTTILSAQHNGPLEDIQSTLTGSLPRDGSAPMTAPLKLADGDAANPALRFASVAGQGLFKTANGIGFAVGGAQVAEIGASGFLAGAPIGAGMDFYGTVAPVGWLFPFGQNISRTTYAALWAAMGSPNTGDGSTTFTMPDKRGRASFGKDDMGGSAANRIQAATTITTTNASAMATVASAAGLAIGMTVTSANIPPGVTISAINGTTLTLSTGTGVTAGSNIAARFSALGDAQVLGSAGGAQTATLVTPQLPVVTPAGSVGISVTNNQTPVTRLQTADGTNPIQQTGYWYGGFGSPEALAASASFSGTPFGGGQPHNILPPGIVCNYLIFAGV